MIRFLFFILTFLMSFVTEIQSQEVPIINYSVNDHGQAEIKVNSTTSDYFILNVRHTESGQFDQNVSMTMGQSGTTTITEPLGNYPLSHYQVLKYAVNNPFDSDGDGVKDVIEFQNLPIQSPFNAADPIAAKDGLLSIDSFSSFKKLSIKKDQVPWSEFLNGKGFVKYIITDFYSNSPSVYFINSDKFDLHEDFAKAIGIEFLGDNVKKGNLIYHPSSISANGTIGAFAFNYSNGYSQTFEVVQRTCELLAVNMPFLKNNLSYYITEKNETQYQKDLPLFEKSRVAILFEKDVYADVNYWGLNLAEGYGFFRKLTLEELPGAKDIVYYETLPNSLPRVGGIITSFIQTPLSHVNLRAIQNKVPNAFIRDPLLIDSIANLLDHYIYFKAEQDKYIIREATLDEVNNWFEKLRPKKAQVPVLNLNYQEIMPLDQMTFTMSDGFGAKCANVATMRKFGFPEGTIPNGFGLPFYFYQEFMKYNNLFEEAEKMIAKSDFIADRAVRDAKLKDFRRKIKDATMPPWMMDALTVMQNSFPEGTPIRCRSSTNNEDLPGFNGAGLYDSKTQHPDEGHISKSIKQVFSSLWNLRAFEERDFYWVDHFMAAMGVLCQPNYEGEKVNGVGVSTDPIYNTENTFYLNSQVGEELITNPGNSIPEEILLDRVSLSSNDYIVIQHSNLVEPDSIMFSEPYLDQMRDYLNVIHERFKVLYNAQDNDAFAMDIEYKITAENQLVIKQARPWVTGNVDEPPIIIDSTNFDYLVYPNPAINEITVYSKLSDVKRILITDILGNQFINFTINNPDERRNKLDISKLNQGAYVIFLYGNSKKPIYISKFIKIEN